MKQGKRICNELKKVRKRISDANGIVYNPTPCSHEGDCAGTCPACDAELRYIERELSLRRMAGKAAVIAGLSIGVMSLSSCGEKKTVESTPNKQKILLKEKPIRQQQTGDSSAVDSEDTVEKPVKFYPPVPIVGAVVVEVPHFPGGADSLQQFLKSNLVYPDSCKRAGIEGRVVVLFAIAVTELCLT